MAIKRFRKDDLENALNKGAMWAITYGDLMSYLMIFFLVLFSFSIATGDKTHARKYEESLANIQKVFGGKIDTKGLERARIQEKEDEVVKKLKKSMAEKELSKFIQIQSTERKIQLVLTAPILFDSGMAKLKKESKPILLTIIKELKGLPNDIVVEGHTDNVPLRGGRFSSNWELSMYRAYSVVRFFEQNGIRASKLAGIGYGEHRPVADNSTQEGKAQNRRIEIDLIKME